MFLDIVPLFSFLQFLSAHTEEGSFLPTSSSMRWVAVTHTCSKITFLALVIWSEFFDHTILAQQLTADVLTFPDFLERARDVDFFPVNASFFKSILWWFSRDSVPVRGWHWTHLFERMRGISAAIVI